MSEVCQRYAELSDRAILGEPLAQEERAFMIEHSARCLACRAEASVWSALAETLENPDRLTDAFPVVDQAAAAPTQRQARLPRHSRRLVAGASVVAVAAASALWIGSRTSQTRHTGPETRVLAAAAQPAPIAEPQLVLVAGTTNVNRQPSRSGRRLVLGDDVEVASGRACLLVPPGVTVCADVGSRLKVEQLDAEARRLRLYNGHAVARLEPQPNGSSFGFETSAGAILAKGTVFSLQAFDDQLALRVHEGTVVQHRVENFEAFAAPAAVLLSRSAPAVRPADQLWSADMPLLDVAKRFTDRATCELQVTSAGDRSRFTRRHRAGRHTVVRAAGAG